MKAKVLYVDDEQSSLMALKRLFRNEPYEFITYDSPIEALRKIELIKPAVVISDQRMPEMRGTVFLEHVKKMHPYSVRIILTGHADLEAAMEAINRDHVFRFIQKPWDDEELKIQVRAALEHQVSIHSLKAKVDALLDEIRDNEKALNSIRKLAVTVFTELEQPLMVMGAYAQLLQDAFKNDEIPCSYLAAMVSQIDQIGKLAQKMESIAHKAQR